MARLYRSAQCVTVTLRVVRVAQAIADPTRRQLLELVRDRELPAGELAASFDVSRPAVSRHLRVLREAGLVRERRQGRLRLYRADPEPLDELRTWLDAYWAGRLEALKRAAELRRALPHDTEVEDYAFEEAPGREVRLSELFTGPDRSLIVYQFMYGGAQTSPCPMCSMWIDGLNGVA